MIGLDTPGVQVLNAAGPVVRDGQREAAHISRDRANPLTGNLDVDPRKKSEGFVVSKAKKGLPSDGGDFGSTERTKGVVATAKKILQLDFLER